ncbi:MAG: succinylglutamate desuccinylase, partial [[Eubacterium] saphenum]|nr:succinylglutamate desuccinylase [[Eubacterium] saphenum]
YREIITVGSAVKEGDVLARILHPYEGEVIREVKAPVDGTVFFARHKSIICQHSLVFKIVKK